MIKEWVAVGVGALLLFSLSFAFGYFVLYPLIRLLPG